MVGTAFLRDSIAAARYATLRMLCPEEGEDDSSITDDSGDASSDSYEASSPELSAKARRAMMKVTKSMWDLFGVFCFSP